MTPPFSEPIDLEAAIDAQLEDDADYAAAARARQEEALRAKVGRALTAAQQAALDLRVEGDTVSFLYRTCVHTLKWSDTPGASGATGWTLGFQPPLRDDQPAWRGINHAGLWPAILRALGARREE